MHRHCTHSAVTTFSVRYPAFPFACLKVAAIRAQAPAELAAVLLAPAGQLDSDAFKVRKRRALS